MMHALCVLACMWELDYSGTTANLKMMPIMTGFHIGFRGSVSSGHAGRCVILSCNGQRTMRTCLAGAERLSAEDIAMDDFQAKWVFLSGYILYRHATTSLPSCCQLTDIVVLTDFEAATLLIRCSSSPRWHATYLLQILVG